MALENPLWHYVLKLYSRPGVEDACLALQTRGAAVNRLLLACWAGSQGIVLDEKRWRALGTDWRREVVEPLRQVRYRVRRQYQEEAELEASYRALKAAELACEQAELMQFHAQLSGWHPERVFEPDVLIGDNLAAYCEYEGLSPDAGMLEPLLQAALAMPGSG